MGHHRAAARFRLRKTPQSRRAPDGRGPHPYGKGYPAEIVHAIKSHATYLGVPRDSLLDRALFAVDELTGFIVAVTLMQPSRKLADLKTSSVRRKIKQKGFAQAASRDDIHTGASELGVDLDEHIAFVRDAMAGIAHELNL